MVHAALSAAGEKPGALEDTQVLRDRRKGHSERQRELGDGRFGRRGELREDGAARGVRERLERRVEGRTGIVNHQVNYYAGDRRLSIAGCQRPYSPKALTRNTAICPRVLGLNGQYRSGETWQPPVTPSA